MPKKWLPSWPENMPRTLVFPEKPLPEFLSDHARHTPEKVAFNFYGREIPFREFDQRTNQLAMALMDFGLKKGDRVSLFLENSPQFVIGYFAILKAGGVVVAANPMFKEEELKYELTDAGARILIAQDFLYPRVRNVREEAGLFHVILTSYCDYLPATPSLPLHSSMSAPKERFPETLDLLEVMGSYPSEPVNIPVNLREDLALLQYTSGTTRLPKGAMITHFSLLTNTVGSAVWDGVQAQAIHLSVFA